MDDLKYFCCQNPDCQDYGQRDCDNLRVCFRYGPHKQRRVLACRTCQHRFSERKGTPSFHCKLPEDKAISVLQHLQESCGVRQTGRLVGVNKNTVVRLAVLAGEHAQGAPRRTSWLFPPQTREVQFDEKWSFVGKKEKHCDPDKPADARQGDNWDHVAFDPEHRLVVECGLRQTDGGEVPATGWGLQRADGGSDHELADVRRVSGLQDSDLRGLRGKSMSAHGQVVPGGPRRRSKCCRRS